MSKFRLVKEAGVFDHFDRMPQPGEEAAYLRASQKYGLPIRSGLWSYTAGRDEGVLEKNVRLCKEAGAEVHDIMLRTEHASGRKVKRRRGRRFLPSCLGRRRTRRNHDRVRGAHLHVDRGLSACRAGRKSGPRARSPVQLRARSQPCAAEVDNPEEQDVSGIRADVAAGRLIIDPCEPGNVLDEWIAADMTIWLQVRPVSPAGPKNPCELKSEGHWGRACQYPFKRPRPGEWVHPWSAHRVEPCKEVVRRVLRRHRDNPASRLRWITTDMIDMADYGGGVGYSLIEQNIAIAEWIRKTWAEIEAEPRRKESSS